MEMLQHATKALRAHELAVVIHGPRRRLDDHVPDALVGPLFGAGAMPVSPKIRAMVLLDTVMARLWRTLRILV